MSSVRARKDGRLFFDFYYEGVRCRELSNLKDSPDNRRRMERVLAVINAEIAQGTFDYARTFPRSNGTRRFANTESIGQQVAGMTMGSPEIDRKQRMDLPTFAEFAGTWKLEKQVEWRVSYRQCIDSILEAHIFPAFGSCSLDGITRAQVLQFRSLLVSGCQGAKGGHGVRKPLASRTVNRVIGILSMIMEEACLRYEVSNPCQGIKRLKVQRVDIVPFSTEEMDQILKGVRKDYRPYLTFRFLTGVRSGEAHGLKWKHVDFERRQILIRETYKDGRTEYTKTEGSQREIHMSGPVLDALRQMQPRGYAQDPSRFEDAYVFHTRRGKPIDNSNFTDRIWKPLLARLNIRYRRPYEMRHTCATLWLAAGESPEWIARQLGHTTTEMLFRTYSRFVPNLVRRDGIAFENMLSGLMGGSLQVATTVESAEAVAEGITKDQGKPGRASWAR